MVWPRCGAQTVGCSARWRSQRRSRSESRLCERAEPRDGEAQEASARERKANLARPRAAMKNDERLDLPLSPRNRRLPKLRIWLYSRDCRPCEPVRGCHKCARQPRFLATEGLFLATEGLFLATRRHCCEPHIERLALWKVDHPVGRRRGTQRRAYGRLPPGHYGVEARLPLRAQDQWSGGGRGSGSLAGGPQFRALISAPVTARPSHRWRRRRGWGNSRLCRGRCGRAGESVPACREASVVPPMCFPPSQIET